MEQATKESSTMDPAYAGFWKRFGASMIDSIALVAVMLPLLVAIYGTGYFQMSQAGETGAGDFLVQVVLPAVLVILFWIKRGATPGKMMLGMKVVDAQTLGPLSTGQAIGRYFAYFVSTIPLLLGFFWVAFDRRKQGWHDKLAKTVVIEQEDKV